MNRPARDAPAADLLAAAIEGDRRSVGRLLSRVEAGGPAADAVSEATHSRAGNAHIIGITGAPGSGKSTLVGQLVKAFAEAGKRPAVLAIDPSSPLSGGAILGDRVRMDGVVAENDVFIRSMATRGHQGGLALAVPAAVRVFDAAGYDPVIIETVGVGQVEVDVVSAADTAVVVVAPGMGDAVQANKAGLLEVADLFVVNKADRHGASDSRRDLELMLDLGHITGAEDPTGHRPEIMMTVSTTGEGIPELPGALAAHMEHLISTNTLDDRRIRRLRAEVRSRLDQAVSDRIDALLATAPAQKSLTQEAGSATDIANELEGQLFGATLPQPIVDVEWLAANIDQVRVVDVRSYMDGRSGRDAYTAGHIPGAGFAHLDEDLSAPVGATGGRHPLPDPNDFAAVMTRLGISDDTPVVAYDDAGGTIAARLWWMLQALGRPVAVLDGGIPAWIDAGHAVSSDTPDPSPTASSPTAAFTATPWPADLTISADDVADRLGSATTILDARSNQRFLGEPFPVDPRYGHVPGARSAPATANIDPDTGRFESIDQARERYEAVGALDGSEVVAYCGSGVTACTDLLQLQRLGVTGRLYVGSWSDWGADETRPLETGE